MLRLRLVVSSDDEPDCEIDTCGIVLCPDILTQEELESRVRKVTDEMCEKMLAYLKAHPEPCTDEF